MPVDDPKDTAEGVLIRAENGDVVTFDETGLTLRLSDRVVADLRRRLGVPSAPDAGAAALLGDIDAWGLRQVGDWLHFTARLEADRPPRDFRKPLDGGDIIADAIGPLQAIFSLGGARRAGFNDGPPAFPYHIVAPADDVFSVGFEGTDEAHPVAGLQRIPHTPRDALIAEALLQMRYDARAALPLIVARTETDNSASLEALNGGQAYVNLLAAFDSLVAAAARLGKPARVLAVGIDLSLEDQIGDPASKLVALRRLMTRIERDMAQRGLHRPVFLITAEAGSWHISTHPSILAHWQLAWAHAPHRVALPAPGYMFEQTRFARPTPAARVRMAEMDAHAITAKLRHSDWFCPQVLLAEAKGKELRVTLRAMTGLVIEDRFGCGLACGFAVQSAGKPYAIKSVKVDPADAEALILTLDRALSGAADLCYAYGAATPSPDAFPANRGAVRDAWSVDSRAAGGTLHRWALPALIPIHPGEW
ncbi:MAG: hypothetical protein ACOH2M_14725 [Cypionkella sp.]